MCVLDDVDLNSVASIPGMGIPEQLKAAMEQEQSSKSHPGTPICRFPDFKEKSEGFCNSRQKISGTN